MLEPGARIRNKLTKQVGLLENAEIEEQAKEKIKDLNIKHPYYYLVALSVLVDAKSIKLRLKNGMTWRLSECEILS